MQLKNQHLTGSAAANVTAAVDCTINQAKANVSETGKDVAIKAAAQTTAADLVKKLSMKANKAKAVAASQSEIALEAQKSATLAADVATEQTNQANRLAETASKLSDKAKKVAAEYQKEGPSQ